MRLVLIAMLATACGAFAQRSGGGGHGGGFRGSGHPSAAPRVSHVHAGTAVVPYPVFYGGYTYFYDPSLYGSPYTDQSPPAGQAPPAGYDSGYYNGGYGDTGAANGAPGQAPVVIINQNFRPDAANPVLKDYSNSTLPPPGAMPEATNPPPDDQPTIYLIAMKDHTIFPAVA